MLKFDIRVTGCQHNDMNDSVDKDQGAPSLESLHEELDTANTELKDRLGRLAVSFAIFRQEAPVDLMNKSAVTKGHFMITEVMAMLDQAPELKAIAEKIDHIYVQNMADNGWENLP